MEISGKIIAILPIQSGQGKNGLWRSQDFVLETGDQYPKKVCFNLFNDKIDKFPIAMNDNVTVSIDIDAREYNGRWYNTIRAWNVKKEETNSAGSGDNPPLPTPPPYEPSDENDGTGLPF